MSYGRIPVRMSIIQKRKKRTNIIEEMNRLSLLVETHFGIGTVNNNVVVSQGQTLTHYIVAPLQRKPKPNTLSPESTKSKVNFEQSYCNILFNILFLTYKYFFQII